jgi:heme/copper-type cytochrome/quinol oxidase subunit 2
MNRRSAILVGLGVAVLIALFLLFRPSSKEGAPSSPTVTGSTEVRVELAVSGGQVLGGGPRTVDVPLGATVSLGVTSDVADEVHVHGYDITHDVAPDAPAELTFVADAEGVFEVELEDAGLLLAELEVSA